MLTRHLLPVEEGALPLTVVENGGAGAALVIMPSAFGVGADLEAQMHDLARDACVVVALDPFFRSDAGPAPYEDTKRVVARIGALDSPRALADLRATIEWTRRGDACAPIVTLGICFGGPFALLAGIDASASGVIAWHGTKMTDTLDRAAELRCPLRMHFGGADPFVSLDSVDAIRVAFERHEDARIFVHERATHGFTHRGAARAYDEPAERAAMASVRELVARAQ
jgi:carboxymethylenebutenolidase